MATQSQSNQGIYTGDAIKEGVMQLIYQVSPEDTPLLNLIGSGRATNVKHEWLTRTRGARAGSAGVTDAVPPGDDVSGSNLADFLNVARPSRDVNYCEIFRQLIYIDETTAAMNHHGINDLMGDQIDFRATDFAITIENACFNGTQNAGPATASATTAWQMGGFASEITTNTRDEGGAGSLTEAEFNTELDDAWVNGAKPQDLFSGPFVRGVLNAYAGGTVTKYLETREKAVFNTVDVYESSTQNLFLHLSRDINNTAGSADLYIIDRTFCRIMWLREPFIEKLPRTRGADMARLEGQCTLEFGDESAHIEITDILA